MEFPTLFLALCDAWCRARNVSEATLSTRLFGSGRDLPLYRAGDKDIGSKRLQRAIRMLAADWPDGAEWPVGLHRPSGAEALEAAE